MEDSVPTRLSSFRGMPPPACGLRRASRLALALTAVALALAGLILLDGLMRAADQDRPSLEWMRRLDLCAPALWPAGTPQRHPGALPAGMALQNMLPPEAFITPAPRGAGQP